MRKLTPIAKAAAVLVFCAGLAVAGLTATGPQNEATARRNPDLMRGYYPVSMPRYPGVREYPMTDKMSVGESNLKMSYYYTPDDPLKVANFYTDRWLAKGYHVTRDITMTHGFVSALDVKAQVTRQVLIYRQDHRTAVFPSVHSGLTAMGPEIPAPDTPLDDRPPVFPGAEGVMRFGAKDPGTASRITVFVNYGGLEANLEFYKVEMSVRGWTQKTHFDGLPSSKNRNHHALLFAKGNREITINLMRMGNTNQVRVHITEAGAR